MSAALYPKGPDRDLTRQILWKYAHGCDIAGTNIWRWWITSISHVWIELEKGKKKEQWAECQIWKHECITIVFIHLLSKLLLHMIVNVLPESYHIYENMLNISQPSWKVTSKLFTKLSVSSQ